MEELCQPSIDGRGGPIASIPIQATDFGLRHHMIQQVQNTCQFHGFPGDDANRHIDKFLEVTQHLKQNGISNDALRLSLFPYSLTHHSTASYDRLSRNSIHFFDERMRKFLSKYFPPSMKKPEECYELIENMTAHHNHWDTSAERGELTRSTTYSSPEIATLNKKLDDLSNVILKMSQSNQQVNVVNPSCETCGGPHHYTECPAVGGYTQEAAYATTAGVAEDVFLKVGKFYLLADFVVLDYEVDPRVPLILGRPFLRMARALIDVYGEEMTLRVNDEAIMFKVGHTSRYSRSYYDETVHQVNVIDVACEEYAQEVLGFLDSLTTGNPTPSDPIIASSSPSFTPFEGGDFILEETETFLRTPEELSNLDDDYYDTEGDILYLEKLLNKDPSLTLPLMKNDDHNQVDVTMTKPSIKEPPKLELKDLPSHLEYAFLEGTDKLPVIISKELKDEEKAALLKQDQEKTTFTCPCGTFAYRRMPFGLCKLRARQRWPDGILKRLIRGKQWRSVGRFSVFSPGLRSTELKVDVIAKLPHPTSVKGVRSFLGHTEFYRRFIQDFSKIARPMTYLLEKETPFVFSKECIEAFNILKKKLTEAPILVSPDWDLPFEIMCDASDYAVGAVLGKQLLAVVYAFEKFWPYLVLSKTIVYTDHSALKYLLAKQDAKPRFLWWILLLQEFNVIIRDKKGVENLAADHLSRLENPHELMLKYGVTHHFSTAYHPQTSGQVEVSNRGLKRILERTIRENRASWSDKLDDALWTFRTAFKTPIGCTPYKLVYEKACHLPIEFEHKAYWALKHCNFDLKTEGDHQKVKMNELNELRDQAYENSLIYKEKTKKIHDSKIKNRVFNVGDRVLLFNSRLKIFLGKLKTHWTGPFTVAQVFLYGTISYIKSMDQISR
ncbi:reverse transcriptase domain-containing protein [Tanacetum coccineum]